jgi:hypothetical protein
LDTGRDGLAGLGVFRLEIGFGIIASENISLRNAPANSIAPSQCYWRQLRAKAAKRNQLQRSINILPGSVLATIGLTIPAVLMIEG